jgi:hypothetical protein
MHNNFIENGSNPWFTNVTQLAQQRIPKWISSVSSGLVNNIQQVSSKSRMASDFRPEILLY